MGVIEETRQIVQDFLAPELREIRAVLSSIDKRLDSMEEVSRTRHESIVQRIDTMDKRLDSQDKRLEFHERGHSRPVRHCRGTHRDGPAILRLRQAHFRSRSGQKAIGVAPAESLRRYL
jgi:hypothetical protein